MGAEDEAFLARWSRRKRDAVSAARSRPTAEGAEAAPPGVDIPPAPETTEPVVDLASLPPIESIGAGSDIRAFLAPGVPLDLARAALRRAWSTDPAIRDFIGLSENSWDFNAPDGIPGFGSMSADDARRLLVHLTGESKPPAESGSMSEPAHEPAATVVASSPRSDKVPAAEVEPSVASDTADQTESNDVATQHDPGGTNPRPAPACSPRRRHGGALPE